MYSAHLQESKSGKNGSHQGIDETGFLLFKKCPPMYSAHLRESKSGKNGSYQGIDETRFLLFQKLQKSF